MRCYKRTCNHAKLMLIYAARSLLCDKVVCHVLRSLWNGEHIKRPAQQARLEVGFTKDLVGQRKVALKMSRSIVYQAYRRAGRLEPVTRPVPEDAAESRNPRAKKRAPKLDCIASPGAGFISGLQQGLPCTENVNDVPIITSEAQF